MGDRVCTHLIAFESIVTAEGVHESKVQWFEGNYSEYLQFKSNQKKQEKQAQKELKRKEKEDEIGKMYTNHSTSANGKQKENGKSDADKVKMKKIEVDEMEPDLEHMHAVIVENET